MRIFSILSLLVLGALAALATDNGLTTAVTWDEYSLMVNGERVYIFSGEFAYERVPNPELWRDILQKYKANGLNGVSIYFFWSYHSPREGVFDFRTPARDIQKLFDIAKEVGLYVIARPGPYCNAETNGGGFALYTGDGSIGVPRSGDETYYEAWLPWIQEVDAIIAKNQITEGGNVIIIQMENELVEVRHDPDNTLVIYMEQLENATREAGVIVPTSHNEKGMRGQSWSTDYQDVGGAVNIYGLDSYPGGLSCTNENTGFNVVRTYWQWFTNYSYTQPEYSPEFEAGWFSPWGADVFYDECTTELSPAFPDVYYKNMVGQQLTLLNLYMAFGGTNWGNLAAPVVYTSYDYSAPLRETREVRNKFKQTKLLGLFTRVSKDLLKTEMESNGTGNAVSSSDIYSWVLRNGENGAGFYTVQQQETPSRAVVSFDAYLNTSAGMVTVPGVELNGRQSKILTTDYHLGEHTLLYCSADVATYGIFGDETVLVMYLDVGQKGEFAFKDAPKNLSFKTYGSANVSASAGSKNATGSEFTKYTYTQTTGSTVLQFSNGVSMYLLDQETAWNFWAPPTTLNPDVAPDEQVFALGPHIVRNVSLAGDVVSLIGDNANTTSLEVFAGHKYSSIRWNGKELATKRTAYGSLKATAPGAEDRSIDLPQLSWVTADSLPEAQQDYDDSKWVVCNKSSSLSPETPLSLPVLFAADYKYYPGPYIYRGYFDGTRATSANATMQGGLAAGFSAWLNGKYVGGNTGDAEETSVSAMLDFSGVSLSDKGNVLTIVTDYTGHDETSTGEGVKNARGLLGVTLAGGNSTLDFTQWKIQGNAGADANIDPVRGSLNEDGIHGTRLGWHLPGFDPTGDAWSEGSPLDGLNSSGISWYITHFNLDIDEDLDVPLGIEFGAPEDTFASVNLYVNGYQYGKYIPQIGPQTRFPFPPGVINNQGNNTIAVSLWAQTDAGARLSTASLFAYEKYQTGFNFSQDWNELQPGWTSDRLQYA
ncbi:hypothetical protein NU195Hw_g5330t1 [Hortaea werneckii]